MKKTILILGIFVCSATVITQLCASPLPAYISSLNNAMFSWAQTVFDFGNIKANTPVSHVFKFKNQGDAPLVISSVQASCGCTVTDYSKDPIEAGGEGYVKATYNAAKVGTFNKTVTVNANTTDGVVLLTIKGVVVE